jgi:hypothetical protein
MKYRVKMGRHRFFPFLLWVWFNKKERVKYFYFYNNCKYNIGADIDTDDQNDTNKLFGIGYLWNKNDSARIGFAYRYMVMPDKMLLRAYCHVGDKLNPVIKDLCYVDFNKWYRGKIRRDASGYFFEITEAKSLWFKLAECFVPSKHNKKFSFPMGIYFGGNKAAPQDMMIELKNKI